MVRHPRLFIHFWSHHEKMCIIDAKVVFMGGIDLCFGRFEMDEYPLKEPDLYVKDPEIAKNDIKSNLMPR